VKAKVGEKEAGNRFIAITDPGSKCSRSLKRTSSARYFLAFQASVAAIPRSPTSEWSPLPSWAWTFAKFLKNTEEMVRACGASSAADSNPGVILGTILGVAQLASDKLTIVTSPGIFASWRLAWNNCCRITGKIGKGIIPVDRERLASPAAHGKRSSSFAYLRLDRTQNGSQDDARVGSAAEEAPQALTISSVFFRNFARPGP